ncbi:MAG: hypothetical protein RIS54_1048 [Verrucomicrobiota bacterium]|jgi:soluble cytochrome b562
MRFCRAWLGIAVGLLVAVSAPAQDAEPSVETKGEVTELGQWMDRMGLAMRKLRRQVTMPDLNTESRAQVAIMLEAATKARELTPEKTADLPAAARPAFIAGYQEQIDKLIMSLRDLDSALAAGDNAAAADMVRALRGIQREGHKEYQKEKDRS